MVSQVNCTQMALIQVGEVLWFTQMAIYGPNIPLVHVGTY